jgi:transcriptional regulator with XRE-family HTH domain
VSVQDDRRGTEVGTFLRAMRARVRPEDVGLPGTGHRRTPGLRRQEVAQLAAVSIEWYIRLEQGKAGTPGSAVLDGIAEALMLSAAEREYLHLTARGEVPPPRRGTTQVTASLRAVLDGMPLLPAYVIDHCFDILAHNNAATAMFGEKFGDGDNDDGVYGNSARILFLDPRSRVSQLSWEHIARETVGALRGNLARHRDDPRLAALIDELRAASPEFATWWDDHTVQERTHGTKRVQHPDVGMLTVTYDFLAVGDSGQRLVVVTPVDPATEQALRTLVAARSEQAGVRRLRASA